MKTGANESDRKWSKIGRDSKLFQKIYLFVLVVMYAGKHYIKLILNVMNYNNIFLIAQEKKLRKAVTLMVT
jgi:hypothetical protein